MRGLKEDALPVVSADDRTLMMWLHGGKKDLVRGLGSYKWDRY